MEALYLYQLAEPIPGYYIAALREETVAAPAPREYDTPQPAFVRPIRIAAERAWATGKRNPVVLCPEQPAPKRRLKSVVCGTLEPDSNEL
jgi:hypothetical protein